jgi:hypothetical protein
MLPKINPIRATPLFISEGNEVPNRIADPRA